ncbi:acyl carrier protein [Micromonospora sp. NPDC126480]|uniref:acyl carrier protein n=1 Tax=Micromonospora sp. NPDC126480 TaxID=3155312 RepID=UPI003330AF91
MSQPPFAELLADLFGVEPAEVVDDAGPTTIGAWTSMRHIQLVVTLEEVYGVAFSADEIKSFRSVGDVRQALTGRGVAV